MTGPGASGRALRLRLVPLPLLFLALAAAPARDPAGWRRVTLSGGSWSGPGYGIALPPGVEGGEIEGIDSAVAELRGAGIHMLFDYGPYGGYSACNGRAGCVERTETIDGRQARISTIPGRVAARIVVRGGLTVDLYGDCTSAEACANAVQMIRTIRFDRRAAGQRGSKRQQR